MTLLLKKSFLNANSYDLFTKCKINTTVELLRETEFVEGVEDANVK